MKYDCEEEKEQLLQVVSRCQVLSIVFAIVFSVSLFFSCEFGMT